MSDNQETPRPGSSQPRRLTFEPVSSRDVITRTPGQQLRHESVGADSEMSDTGDNAGTAQRFFSYSSQSTRYHSPEPHPRNPLLSRRDSSTNSSTRSTRRITASRVERRPTPAPTPTLSRAQYDEILRQIIADGRLEFEAHKREISNLPY